MSESRKQQRHPSTHDIQNNRATRGALRESLPAITFGALNVHSEAVRRLSVDVLSVLSRTLQLHLSGSGGSSNLGACYATATNALLCF